MHCADRKDNLVLYALGALEGAELHAVRAHLETGCVVCAAYLAQTHALLSMLPLSLAPTSAPNAAKDALMRRVQNSITKLTPAKPQTGGRRPSFSRRIMPALVGALAASLCAVLILGTILFRQYQAFLSFADRSSLKDQQIEILQAQIAEQHEVIRLVESPSTLIVKLNGTEKQPRASATLYWDPATRMAHFDAVGLQSLSSDKMYELWFVNEQKAQVPAGLFKVNAAGEASLTSSMKMPGNLTTVAVTDEPAAGREQPTGSFQLVGNLKRDN